MKKMSGVGMSLDIKKSFGSDYAQPDYETAAGKAGFKKRPTAKRPRDSEQDLVSFLDEIAAETSEQNQASQLMSKTDRHNQMLR